MSWKSTLALISIFCSTVGSIISTVILGAFIKNNKTPVVKAAGRELTYIILGGTYICHSMVFILFFNPTPLLCGIQEFFIGLSFSIVYGAILIKTNRISRIFEASKRTSKRPKMVSPKSQIVLCLALVFLQIVVNMLWLMLKPSAIISYFPTRHEHFIICKAALNTSYMVAFSYPILLVFVCTWYALT